MFKYFAAIHCRSCQTAKILEPLNHLCSNGCRESNLKHLEIRALSPQPLNRQGSLEFIVYELCKVLVPKCPVQFVPFYHSPLFCIKLKSSSRNSFLFGLSSISYNWKLKNISLLFLLRSPLFVLFKQIHFSNFGIRIQIVRVEGEYADH